MLQLTAPIILASKSPRRQELLTLMGLAFSVELKEVDESYPASLSAPEIAVYVAEKKANAFNADPEHIIITADTIVAINGEILGKPENNTDAQQMLAKLSGTMHEVYTGVSINYKGKITSFYEAGSYGIQDWFGLAVVERLNGSYTNVMGLPTEKLYQHLLKL